MWFSVCSNCTNDILGETCLQTPDVMQRCVESHWKLRSELRKTTFPFSTLSPNVTKVQFMQEWEICWSSYFRGFMPALLSVHVWLYTSVYFFIPDKTSAPDSYVVQWRKWGKESKAPEHTSPTPGVFVCVCLNTHGVRVDPAARTKRWSDLSSDEQNSLDVLIGDCQWAPNYIFPLSCILLLHYIMDHKADPKYR